MQLSVNPLIRIPPGAARWFITRECNVRVQESETNSPGRFRAVGVTYHAHLLGREMYMELHQVGERAFDLGSAFHWHFDDQSTRNIRAWNVTVSSGDRLQTTCVMDSRGRQTITVFGPETTDEMCFASLKGYSESGHRLQLSCQGSIWTGELAVNEPGLGVALRHPASSAPWRLDGTNLFTGGSLEWSDMVTFASDSSCRDAAPLANGRLTCSMLMTAMQLRGGRCESNMSSFNSFLANFVPLRDCCVSACMTICAGHADCPAIASSSSTTAPISTQLRQSEDAIEELWTTQRRSIRQPGVGCDPSGDSNPSSSHCTECVYVFWLYMTYLVLLSGIFPSNP